jgi:hypothetical protein
MRAELIVTDRTLACAETQTVSRSIAAATARSLTGFAQAIDALGPLPGLGMFVIAVLLVLAHVPWGQNADDLLPALMSSQKLTLYYWGENRFANLLPALTQWIGSPVRNAEAQLALRIVAGMTAPAFVCALFYTRASHVWRATLAADCLMLLASSPPVLHETYIVATPYGTAFACGAVSIFALRRAWRLAPGLQHACLSAFGAVALLTAHLVDYGLGMMVFPLLGILAVASPSVERQRFLVLNVLAAGIAFVAPKVFAPDYSTLLSLDPSAAYYGRFAATLWSGTGWAFGFCAFVPGLLAICLPSPRPASRRGFLLFAAASGIAILSIFLIAGSSQHVALNSFNLRYAVPALLTLLGLAGIGCWETLRICLPTREVRSVMHALLMALALLLARDRLAASGGPTPDIIGHGEAGLARAVAVQVAKQSLDGIAGDYWHVWPAVFAAEQIRHDARRTAPAVLGVTKRGETQRDVFLARLAVAGTLRLACIDVSAAQCRDEVETIMTRAVEVRELIGAEPMPDGHQLNIVEVTSAGHP